ncbi:helix-turn-helix transcriptional regulator [Nocardioides sp. HM23]|uniref:helix-turn-helix domain-containing protein n=1 Tax=Nocardioides bizhenqiangii TaxID=3095076 RepID=UPI002ACA87ED|nr:helix-turn-helix transcriptional regulator [Nocardioides sp. HM23]MDZ5619395.1 helix-turn-helix transcriptional regulator [Nocardioides sp. HM23]
MIEGELGSFLRARREAVQPEDVGLPRGERRRTPGLRRSELATLAGISVEYLTRLEQGRDRRPSTQVVAAVADALRLDAADRSHLHQLVALSQGTELVCGDGCPGARDVPPGLLTLLDRLEPTPAVLVGPQTEVVAWTDAFDRLVRPLGMLDDARRELLRYAFSDDRARGAVADWTVLADALVTWLHLHSGPGTGAVVAELSATLGREFTSRWESRPTGTCDLGLRAVVHPEVGLIRISPEVLLAGDTLTLVVLLPADGAAQAALDRLTGRHPGALRQVLP